MRPGARSREAKIRARRERLSRCAVLWSGAPGALVRGALERCSGAVLLCAVLLCAVLWSAVLWSGAPVRGAPVRGARGSGASGARGSGALERSSGELLLCAVLWSGALERISGELLLCAVLLCAVTPRNEKAPSAHRLRGARGREAEGELVFMSSDERRGASIT